MSPNKIKGECPNNKLCEYNRFKRDRYFHGMLMTDRDFSEEQKYHIEKRKLHNRMLHGWGVVCGLGIKPTVPESSKVIITPGMALDCLGNEILVCDDFEVDFGNVCSGTEVKGLCEETGGTKDCTRYVCIKYSEISTDPIPVYTPGGGCEERVCDHSRIREGFCVSPFNKPPCEPRLPTKGMLDEIMKCMKITEEKSMTRAECMEKVMKNFCEDSVYPCPSCCCDGEPYVVLGSVDFSETKITGDKISINDKRRYVFTPLLLQYAVASLYPAIATYMDNPFTTICKLIQTSGKIVPIEKKVPVVTEEKEAPVVTPVQPAKVVSREVINKITAVSGQGVDEAVSVLKEHEVNLKRTVPLTPDNMLDLTARVLSARKIEPGMNVDLVTDETGKALFYAPVTEVPEKEELATRLQKAEETIEKLSKQLARVSEERR